MHEGKLICFGIVADEIHCCEFGEEKTLGPASPELRTVIAAELERRKHKHGATK